MNKKPEYTLVKTEPADNTQLEWVIQVDGKQAGNATINLDDSEYIESPWVTITIDEEYRGRGIGSSVLKEMIKYAYCNLTSEILYSRHRTDDATTEKLNKKVGFENDDKPYSDTDGVEWQNVTLVL